MEGFEPLIGQRLKETFRQRGYFWTQAGGSGALLPDRSQFCYGYVATTDNHRLSLLQQVEQLRETSFSFVHIHGHPSIMTNYLVTSRAKVQAQSGSFYSAVDLTEDQVMVLVIIRRTSPGARNPD